MTRVVDRSVKGELFTILAAGQEGHGRVKPARLPSKCPLARDFLSGLRCLTILCARSRLEPPKNSPPDQLETLMSGSGNPFSPDERSLNPFAMPVIAPPDASDLALGSNPFDDEESFHSRSEPAAAPAAAVPGAEPDPGPSPFPADVIPQPPPPMHQPTPQPAAAVDAAEAEAAVG